MGNLMLRQRLLRAALRRAGRGRKEQTVAHALIRNRGRSFRSRAACRARAPPAYLFWRNRRSARCRRGAKSSGSILCAAVAALSASASFPCSSRTVAAQIERLSRLRLSPGPVDRASPAPRRSGRRHNRCARNQADWRKCRSRAPRPACGREENEQRRACGASRRGFEKKSTGAR